MKGKRYTTEDKIRILREADKGKAITEVCPEHNVSQVTFHRWKRQFGQMDISEAKRLKPRTVRRRPKRSAPPRTLPVARCGRVKLYGSGHYLLYFASECLIPHAMHLPLARGGNERQPRW